MGGNSNEVMMGGDSMVFDWDVGLDVEVCVMCRGTMSQRT